MRSREVSKPFCARLVAERLTQDGTDASRIPPVVREAIELHEEGNPGKEEGRRRNLRGESTLVDRIRMDPPHDPKDMAEDVEVAPLRSLGDPHSMRRGSERRICDDDVDSVSRCCQGLRNASHVNRLASGARQVDVER